MSSSKLISGDELTAYQRWELPNVQSAQSAKPDARVEDVEDAEQLQPLTAERLEQLQQDAYREGFEQGHSEGWKAGQADVNDALTRLGQLIDALAEPLNDVDDTVEQELVALAMAIARQIIRREIKSDPGEVVAVVREALTALPSATRKVQITLNPDDAGLVRDALLAQAGEERHWHIAEDPLITRGGCRINAEHSQIDATVEKRIAAIAAKLLGGERRDDGGER